MFNPVIINAKKELIIQEVNPLRNVVFLSLGDTKLKQGQTQLVTAPLELSAGFSRYLVNFSNSFFTYADNASFTVIELEKFEQSSLLSTIKNLPDYGIFACGDSLSDLNGFNTVLKELDNINNPQLFLLGTGKGFTDSGIVQIASQYQGLTNTNLFYENVYNESITGIISGILLSERFRLSGINKISPLIYLGLKGTKFTQITAEQEQQAIQNNISYVSSLIKIPSLFNMSSMDGNDFLFWYSYKYTSLMIKNGLTALLIQSATSGKSLQYNQTGLDMCNSNIVSKLKVAQAYGLINDFGIGGNNAFIEKGIINSIPFNEYIVNNPSDYNNGLYSGFSFTIQIGRYFKKIVLNVTIM